jgi:hypothetical protein
MKSANCECCLMPLDKDKVASESNKYCSKCFVKGKLLAEGMTLKEFQDKAFKGMVNGGHNKLVTWFLTKMIGFAPYWKDKK